MARRGRRSEAYVLRALRAALRHLFDPIALEENPLATSRVVQFHATSTFAGRTCATGLALSHVLRQVLTKISDDLGEGNQIGRLAALLVRGLSQAEIARNYLRVSEEHLTREWKPRLLRLVLAGIRSMDREVDNCRELRHNLSA